MWRCVEAGCEAVLATFGARLTERQQILLESTGVREVLVGYDNDKAGEEGLRGVENSLRRLCKVRRAPAPCHDWGSAAVPLAQEYLRKWGLVCQ